MGDNNTCCTWKVDTNWGTQKPTVMESTYYVNAGHRPLVYKCVDCTREQADKIFRNMVPSAGWAGKIY